MNGIGKFALIVWIPIAIAIFGYVKVRRRALLIAFIGAWLFLPAPSFGIPLKGIPDLTKITAASFGALLGAAIFDVRTLLTFRPKWYDLPMAVFCLSPYITSIKNDLGAWDGLAAVVQQSAQWGLPYFLGRCYFKDWESFRELGVAIVVGGLIYIPFCLFEIKQSPQLHRIVYGRAASDFVMEKRWGGFRPQVFMQSGLAVGLWMTTATLCAIWMWMCGALKEILGVSMRIIVPALFCTTILCKASGAIGFLFAGIGTLLWIKYLRNPLPLLMLMAFPPLYMYQRASLNWDGDWLKEKAYALFGEERGQSLATRVDAENQLTQRALSAPDPWFGWGKWNKDEPAMVPWRIVSRLVKYTSTGEQYIKYKDEAPTDGLWVIIMGQFGIVGVTALTCVLLLPGFVLWLRVPMRFWSHALVAAPAAMTVLLVLDMSDNLLNGLLNPILILALGGVNAIGPSLRKLKAVAPVAQPAPMPLAYRTPAQLYPGAQVTAAPRGYARGAQPGPAPVMEGFPVIPGMQAPSPAPRRPRR